MFSKERAFTLIGEAVDALSRAGIISEACSVKADTALFGFGSNIDSMGFVTLITDIEERLNAEIQRDIFIVLSDIEELYPEAPVLSVSMFADYLVKIANEPDR